jgi:high-affinity iron transporter
MLKCGRVSALRRSAILAAATLLAVFITGAVPALAATPQQDVSDASAIVQKAIASARGGNLAAARQQYTGFENTWFDIEEGVHGASREAYQSIEHDMTAVSVAFSKDPPDQDAVVAALSTLDSELQLFVQGKPASAGSPAGGVPATSRPAAVPAGQPVTIATIIDELREANAALKAGDYSSASATLDRFQNDWLNVEGQVKTRSADDYRQTESDMALAASQANQKSPQASQTVSRMTTRLEPYVQASRYGIFDAAIILLREGLEALLVIAALLAFLKKSANRGGQRWVWSGSALGLVMSIALGLAIQAFFSSIITPSNRELIEGIVGLVAAAMLVYVSYWLHSKSSASGWSNYLRTHTSAAVKGGRLIGLGVLAFLAVFREGAETALFYLGMAANITPRDLFLGLGIGVVGLAALGFLLIVVGMRIPMRPFFTVASVLVFYLCFKFVGTGIHGLQVAGILPAPSAAFLPSVDGLGMYPTWPTTVAQLVLLLVAVWVVLQNRLGRRARLSASVIGAVLLLAGACSPAIPAATPQTAVIATAPAAAAALPEAPRTTSTRREVGLVAGPRKQLEELYADVQKGDFAAARADMESYSSSWNGVEVYVNFRSRELYGEIESHYEADITRAISDPKADAAQILPQIVAMVGTYDEAIKLSDTGPPLSPLFDDLAMVRMVRAPLRTVSPALQAGDVTKAQTGFAAFKAHIAEAKDLISARSASDYQEIQAALEAADKALAASPVDPTSAGLAVDALMERYNYGVNLLNAAARNADTTRSSFVDQDIQTSAGLGAIERD